jgi:hypothetical protein
VVRLLFTRLGPEHVKWSILGERNWVRPEAQEASLSLSDVYPLNSIERRGGCHTWELDLIGEKQTWRLRLHGSNGATAESRISRGKEELSLRIDQDTELQLPTSTTLASVGSTPIRLTLPR